MDSQTVYPGQILPETILLQMNKDAMIGLAKLSAAVLGTSTTVNGFSVTPTSPASLQVNVAPGEIYSLQNVDSTAFSSLAADTTHQIVKQGISLDQQTLTLAAPSTTGQSINYLIQASYADIDSTPVLLPYYNSANPNSPYSGQGNNGLTQNTVRKGAVVLTAKAGVPATTCSQVTPAPDSGYVGLYVVTVAYGQTQIVAGNISQYSAAPLLPSGILQSIQTGNVSFGTDTGTANAYVVTCAPALQSRTEGQVLRFKVKTSNTGACTLNDGVGTAPLVGGAHAALQGGELVANGDAWAQWNSSVGSGSYILLYCTGGAEQVANATQSQHAMALGQVLNTTNDPTFADSSVKPASTGWIRGAMSAIATAAGFACSLTPNGYIKLPSWLGSFIFQWRNVVASGAGTTVNLPLTFPNGCLASYATYRGSSVTPGPSGAIPLSSSQISVIAWGSLSNTSLFWFALGN